MSKKSNTGLTLIEVLIALAIVSIALTAIIKATSQTLKGNTYLETKTLAMFVGQQALNEVRVGLNKITDNDSSEMHTTTILGREIYWNAQKEATPNPRITKVSVRVYPEREPREDSSTLLTLESYVYHAAQI